MKYKGFHGTNETFEKFDYFMRKGAVDQYGSGFYFAEGKKCAEGYALKKAAEWGSPYLIEAEIELKKPIIIQSTESFSQVPVKLTDEQMEEVLMAQPCIGQENSPLGDYFEEFWNLDLSGEHNNEKEIRALVKKLVKKYFSQDFVSWVKMENFFIGQEEALHEKVNQLTGTDGVIVEFGEEKRFFIPWFNRQISILSMSPVNESGPC